MSRRCQYCPCPLLSKSKVSLSLSCSLGFGWHSYKNKPPPPLVFMLRKPLWYITHESTSRFQASGAVSWLPLALVIGPRWSSACDAVQCDHSNFPCSLSGLLLITDGNILTTSFLSSHKHLHYLCYRYFIYVPSSVIEAGMTRAGAN